MGEHRHDFGPTHAADFGLPHPDGGFADPWHDPLEHRAQQRLRLIRYQVGFTLLGVALLIASVLAVGRLLLRQLDLFPVVQWLNQWEFAESSSIVLISLTGVALLWGRWPDQAWQRRSGLLLLLCLIDLVCWSTDHAVALGLSDVEVAHEYFRDAVGAAIGWSEFALIASMAAEMAGSLGEVPAIELGKAARSLTFLTAAVWSAYFFIHTNWNNPIWPLRPFRWNDLTVNLLRCWTLLYTVLLVQVTLLCLGAARACGRTVRAMAAEDRASEAALLPSEHGWTDFQKQSATDFNPWEPPQKP